VRVARVFLDLVHDAQRRAGIGLFRRHREAQALAGHAGLGLFRLGAGAGIVAEGPVEEGLGLRRHPIPIDGRADQHAVGRQEVFQEQLRIAVGRRWRMPQVGQEALDVVVQEKLRGGQAGGLRAAQRGRAQRRAVAVAPGAAHQDQQALVRMM